MDWATSVSWVGLIIGLLSICITLWRTRRSYSDSDVEELADEVARLSRRARADTMRRVRAEKGSPPTDGEGHDSPPPQLRTTAPAVTVAEIKQELRRRLLVH